MHKKQLLHLQKLFWLDFGNHLLSQAAARQVPSTAQVLTVVFGMGTGVSPERIITGNLFLIKVFLYYTFKTEHKLQI